jgi:hypothetical protein
VPPVGGCTSGFFGGFGDVSEGGDDGLGGEEPGGDGQRVVEAAGAPTATALPEGKGRVRGPLVESVCCRT